MSRPVSMLDLASELARRHERAAAERVSVIPVLVDDLESVTPVFEALCAIEGGRILDTRAEELKGPVPGTADLVRRAAIAQALTGQPTTTRHVDLRDVGEGLLDASFADPPAGVASPGEQEVLAVARAAAHGDLDSHRLSVIVYREDVVDLPFRRAIWALAVDQLHGMRHSTLRTVVFVAQSEVNVRLHCETGRGFQFALQGDRLLRRKGADDLRAAVRQISRRQSPSVLFLGAGFGASSRLPLGNDVRDKAIRRLLDIPTREQASSHELAARFHEFVSGRGWLSMTEREMPQEEFIRRLTLEQVIHIEQRLDQSLPTLRDFREHHDRVIAAPGQAALDLAEILQHASGRLIIVEVNFDLLVETHTQAPLQVFASRMDFAGAPEYLQRYMDGRETAVPVLKLHGTISDAATCVVSTDQTELGLGQEKLEALRVLLDPAKPRHWVYVGASMRDLDLRPVLQNEEFARGVDERWVSPYLADTVEEFASSRSARWRGTGFETADDRLISETADAFFSALRQAWLEDEQTRRSMQTGSSVLTGGS